MANLPGHREGCRTLLWKHLRGLSPRDQKPDDSRPLLQVLRTLTFVQIAHFLIGWFAWTCDALDFFSVSLTIPRLDKQFNRTTHALTSTITLTLLFRPIGAAIFGIASDRFGRKWPLVINLLLIACFELGAGFVQTFSQFLILRSMFGIAMGGIWSLSAATALENLPVEVRGVASGILQQGYALGNLLAAIINLTLVPETNSWRSMYWTASAVSLSAALLRMLLPESQFFLQSKNGETSQDKGSTRNSSKKTSVFITEAGQMLRKYWLLSIYAIFFMAGFSFLAHGSQDLYPTYLQVTKGFTEHEATVATIIGCCGALSGGAVAGMLSQYLGRRVTIVLFIIIAGCFIPLWIIPSSFSALAAGAFCMQFGTQGAAGIIPIQFNEISPPAFRATFTGIVYQLGVMASAASAQIEATGGDHMKTTIKRNGVRTVVPDYAKVQGIFCGVVAVFVIFITLIGPENHSSHFEKATPATEQSSAGDGDKAQYDQKEKSASELECQKQTSRTSRTVSFDLSKTQPALSEG